MKLWFQKDDIKLNKFLACIIKVVQKAQFFVILPTHSILKYTHPDTYVQLNSTFEKPF